MHGERRTHGRSALDRTRIAAALAAVIVFVARPVRAEPLDAEAARGLKLAKNHDCEAAVPILEEAERTRHRPSTALALADCYAAAGDLMRARTIYTAVAAETPTDAWTRLDKSAAKSAADKAEVVDERIPTMRVLTPVAYDGLEVEIDGKRVEDFEKERQLVPGTKVTVVARAKGRADFSEKVVLAEGERRVLVLWLAPLPQDAPPPPPPAPFPTKWIGARYYGVVIPKFVMNIIADGGRNLAVPGAAVTFTMPGRGAMEVTYALGYLSYFMTATPFKPHGEPDTEWEFVGSTLAGLTATVDLMWNFPFDAKRHAGFRIGGAIGVGVMPIGTLYRVQSYPATGRPGDPSTYLKCAGPNNPLGTFRYCNALDKDALHYPGFSEPDWFHHGIRPMVFPWLVLPQLGFSFRPARTLAIDIDTGVSVSGFLTSVGFRVGL